MAHDSDSADLFTRPVFFCSSLTWSSEDRVG